MAGIQFTPAQCCCDAVESECVIHSSIASKGKPWPSFTLLSGTAPVVVDNCYQFLLPGKVKWVHDPIRGWDADTDALYDYVPASARLLSQNRKRLSFAIFLDSDDADVIVTTWEDGVKNSRVRFTVTKTVNGGATPSKYPIVHLAWTENLTPSMGGTPVPYIEEHILDKWVDGYAVHYDNAAYYSKAERVGDTDEYNPIGNIEGSPRYELITPVFNAYAAQAMSYRKLDQLTPFQANTGHNEVMIELVAGEARVCDLELRNDYDRVQFDLDETGNPIGCPDKWLKTHQYTLCTTNSVQPMGLWMAGTLPQSVVLRLPTLVDNPNSAEVCNDCEDYGETEIPLELPDPQATYCGYITPGHGAMPWEFHYPLACSAVSAIFEPWYESTVGNDTYYPGVQIVMESGGVFQSYMPTPSGGTPSPDTHPSKIFAGMTIHDWSYCTHANAGVVFDHIRTRGLMRWEFNDFFTMPCALVSDDYVGIRLPDTPTFVTVQ